MMRALPALLLAAALLHDPAALAAHPVVPGTVTDAVSRVAHPKPSAAELTLDNLTTYFGAYTDLLVHFMEQPALARRLARNGESNAAWARRIADTPALREIIESWYITPQQYVEIGVAFYDAWMTHVGLQGPGPRPGRPDPKALQFVRANAGMIGPILAGLMLPHNVAPWPGGPVEQPLPKR